jgi:hypothetical protein
LRSTPKNSDNSSRLKKMLRNYTQTEPSHDETPERSKYNNHIVHTWSEVLHCWGWDFEERLQTQ